MLSLARPSASASSRSVVFCTRNDVTRITTLNQIFGMLAVTATLCGAETALAQNAAAPPAMKTIGTPSAPAKPEIVPSLFVFNSRGATLQGDTLTLTGVTPSSIIFADRPVRSAGHQPTVDVIAEWVPPRGVGIPRSLSTWAMARSEVAPAFCAFRMIGSTLAARASAAAWLDAMARSRAM